MNLRISKYYDTLEEKHYYQIERRIFFIWFFVDVTDSLESATKVIDAIVESRRNKGVYKA